MAITVEGSGTQTATVTTEHTLADVATAGVFQLSVDKNAMAASDVLEIRVYRKILTGGTSRVELLETFQSAQLADDLIYETPPFGNDLVEASALKFTLKQSFGTSRAFPWKVLKYT